jgi:hypothetical protein
LPETAPAAERVLYCTSPETPVERLPRACAAFYLLPAKAAAG